MAEALNTKAVLIVLRERPQVDLGVTPWPVDTVGIPNDHLQYAITWFSLATIWLAMSVYFLRPRKADAMRYISTRGTAPVLNFEETMLTGLARDGGLYVPETIPQLSAAEIASLQGKAMKRSPFA